MTEKDNIALIWYKYGIRAKELLIELHSIQLDDFNNDKFERLQVRAQSLNDTLALDLQEHLKQYPDNK